MANPFFVEDFYARHQALSAFLIEKQELTYAADFSTTFTRSLVLAISSYFEHAITEIMTNIPLERAGGDPVITNMIVRQVITRKYHTFFDWDRQKPGPFWALLGDSVKARVANDMKNDKDIEPAIMAFLELGHIRNKLVHQNFVEFDVQKTPQELIDGFRLALKFPEYLKKILFQGEGTGNVQVAPV